MSDLGDAVLAAVKTHADMVDKVVEMIERHLDANGERRAPYQALRRLRKDMIEELTGMSEEVWDKQKNSKGKS